MISRSGAHFFQLENLSAVGAAQTLFHILEPRDLITKACVQDDLSYRNTTYTPEEVVFKRTVEQGRCTPKNRRWLVGGGKCRLMLL